MTEKGSQKKEMVLSKYLKERGRLSERMQKVMDWDPGFVETFLGLSSYPWKKGVLPPKVKEFIYIAIDASPTHLYEPGIRLHIRRALEQGATKEEILEVLELTVALGIHSCTIGVPILEEVYNEWTSQRGKGK